MSLALWAPFISIKPRPTTRFQRTAHAHRNTGHASSWHASRKQMFSFIFHLKARLTVNSEWNKKKDKKPQTMWGRLPLIAERGAGMCTTRGNDDVKLSRAAQHPMSKDTRSISPQHFSPHVSPVNKVLISLHAALMFYFLFFFNH